MRTPGGGTLGLASTPSPEPSDPEAAILMVDGHFSGLSVPVMLALGIQMPGPLEWDHSARDIQPKMDAFWGWTFWPWSSPTAAPWCQADVPFGQAPCKQLEAPAGLVQMTCLAQSIKCLSKDH